MAVPEALRADEARSLKHLAIQLAAQLPHEPGAALLVLALTETLVRTFLADCGAVDFVEGYHDSRQ